MSSRELILILAPVASVVVPEMEYRGRSTISAQSEPFQDHVRDRATGHCLTH